MNCLDREVLVETVNGINIYFQPLVEDISPFDLFEENFHPPSVAIKCGDCFRWQRKLVGKKNK